jgi:aquaporin Z
MATKKAASTTKKSTVKKSTVKQPTTKVTTVKAVEARPVQKAAAATPRKLTLSRFSNAPLIAALIAEFIGTFLLAAVVIAGQGQPIIVLFALVGIILAIGTLSGGYVNPALTIAEWVTRRISGLRALGYVVAQILGAMLALVLLNSFVNASASDASANMLGAQSLFKAAEIPAGKEWLVFLAEVIGTAVFGFAVAAATRMTQDRTAKAFTVGLGLYLGLMLAGSAAAFLGASAILNPAVAVALQAFNVAPLWPIAVYGLASVLGAVIGFLLFDFLRSAENKA